MLRMSFSQALVALSLLAFSVGCESSEEYVSVTSSADGELDYNYKTDGGVRTHQLFSSNSMRPFPACDGATPCKTVVNYGSIEIRFDPPPNVGTHDLAELQAVVCQDAGSTVEECAPIVGRIDVTDMVAPCGFDACGRFEAALHLKPSKTTKAPAVWGQTRLLYSERVRTQTSGGCDNFQGG
jgi:hypothetical protein